MSRIVISLSGEGLGHAARVYALVEMLQFEHDLLVLTPTSLTTFFDPLRNTCSRTEFFDLPGIRFHYDLSNRVNHAKSVVSSVPFALNLSKRLELVTNRVQRFAADLAIVDFEPLLPRIARTLRIPSLSLDHQHLLAAVDPMALPRPLRNQLRFLRTSLQLFCPRADRYLVSSFFRYAQRADKEAYTQVGVLLRSNLLSLYHQTDGHLLVYLRGRGCSNLMSPLKQLGIPVHVYGLDREETLGSIQLHRTCPIQFLQHLTNCSALITTAGNQLIGEALAIGKPVFAIAECNNFRQQVNGFFLNRTGMGEAHDSSRFTTTLLHRFLERLDEFRCETAKFDAIGNAVVQDSVYELLSTPLMVTNHKQRQTCS